MRMASVALLAAMVPCVTLAGKCDDFAQLAYDLQLERQNGGRELYNAFEPSTMLEIDTKNAVYHYPNYFSERYQLRAAKRFANDARYDCEVRY